MGLVPSIRDVVSVSSVVVFHCRLLTNAMERGDGAQALKDVLRDNRLSPFGPSHHERSSFGEKP